MPALNAQLMHDSLSCDVSVYVRRQANRAVTVKVFGFPDVATNGRGFTILPHLPHAVLPQALLEDFAETFEWLLKDARSSFEISYKNLFATRKYLLEAN